MLPTLGLVCKHELIVAKISVITNRQTKVLTISLLNLKRNPHSLCSVCVFLCVCVCVYVYVYVCVRTGGGLSDHTQIFKQL